MPTTTLHLLRRAYQTRAELGAAWRGSGLASVARESARRCADGKSVGIGGVAGADHLSPGRAATRVGGGSGRCCGADDILLLRDGEVLANVGRRAEVATRRIAGRRTPRIEVEPRIQRAGH